MEVPQRLRVVVLSATTEPPQTSHVTVKEQMQAAAYVASCVDRGGGCTSDLERLDCGLGVYAIATEVVFETMV